MPLPAAYCMARRHRDDFSLYQRPKGGLNRPRTSQATDRCLAKNSNVRLWAKSKACLL